jgi:membrane-associated phospholipid phosphatase
VSATSPTATSDGRRGAGGPLLLAAACVAGMALTWVFAALVPATRVKDAVALYDFTRLDRPVVEVPANALLILLEPEFFVVWGIALVAIALSNQRKRVALAVALVLSLAPASAELLKPLLAHPHADVVPIYIKSASWPSGHATAATALAWCVVLVAPASLRRTVALLGALLLTAVGCALLILAWHMPSDVLGGYLLGTLWFALALAALRAGRSAPVFQSSPPEEPAACSPGAHSSSEFVGAGDPGSSFAARLRINSMSDSRFR